jgi:glycosyltransferase involved in cell wall biosynthesis
MKKENREIDILLLGEGTYPYVKGGVSSWLHQLIRGLPELNFGLVFLGSLPEEYGEIRYELPDNLVYLESFYLFDNDMGIAKKSVKDSEYFESVESLYKWFRNRDGDIPEQMRDIGFLTKQITHDHFLYSEQSWKFIREKYEKNCPDVPFIDYFWTVRNIHKPIWILANIVEKLPAFKIVHSPSTGYAGFLAALASYNTGKPYLLTEHGIYTRERKIDMLSADWVKFQKSALLKQPEEFNYIKKMWVEFFMQIGMLSYHKAQRIYSLFPGARDIQVRFGADETKTEVIPNGVDVDGLSKCLMQRSEKVPKVITLLGRVVSIKDIKTFIRAMRIVVNEMEDVEAWVVGPTDEAPLYVEECQNMVETLKLEKNFFFKGFQNIKDILPLTGLLTLTSVSEGMPLTILEGFAAGIPCVATDVGSCRDLIYGGLNDEDIALGNAGIVTQIANPTALASAYITLLNDEEAWKKAQNVALARVNRYYREDMFLDRYRAIYKEVS